MPCGFLDLRGRENVAAVRLCVCAVRCAQAYKGVTAGGVPVAVRAVRIAPRRVAARKALVRHVDELQPRRTSYSGSTSMFRW